MIADAPQTRVQSEKEIISGLQRTVSASRLSLFLQCRLKFYFRYVAQIKKPKTPALHLGSAVHAVLNAWNKARWQQKPLKLKDIHEIYQKAWADTSEGKPDWDAGEDEEDKTTGWRLIDTYLRESHFPQDLKPDAVEVPVEADLWARGLPKLVGILDLVQRGIIVDYKTSSTTPNPEKTAHTNEIQTTTYAILYRHNTDKREQGIELHHLVKLKNPKICITPLPPMSKEQEKRLYRLMDGYVAGLDSTDFIPSPGMQCLSCEYHAECRRWH